MKYLDEMKSIDELGNLRPIISRLIQLNNELELYDTVIKSKNYKHKHNNAKLKLLNNQHECQHVMNTIISSLNDERFD